MKKLTFLLLIACLTAGTTAQAQNITFHKKNASLKDLLKAVAKQTGYGHIFKEEAGIRIKRVNISVTNSPLREVLDEFFKEQAYTYSIIGLMISIQPKAPSPTDIYTLSGRVTNEANDPVPGATITLEGTTRSIAVNDDGEFLFPDISRMARLVVTSITHETMVIELKGQPVLHAKLKSKVSELKEVAVVVSTGYQNVMLERSVGSFSKVNNELLNRRVSPDVLSRLDGVTPGMIFNKNINPIANQSKITIRGRSTIFSNPEPLIIIDNFPYPGDPDNINPNDIENVTILKDANAAAIWGAFAGNGVIVINTKKGRYRQAPRLTLNNNVTIGERPDAYYLPVLRTREYIGMEKELFYQGFYDPFLANSVPQLFSPVVEQLFKEREGIINDTELRDKLDWFGLQDTRREREKYLYRNSVSQQHALSTSGGGTNSHYFLSAGFDRSLDGFVGNKSQRITLNANNTYSWIKNRLELSTSVAYSERKITSNYHEEASKYPYLKFFDEKGVPYAMPRDIRQRYKDEIVLQYPELKDWNYNHWREVHIADNTEKIIDYRVNLGLKYKISKGLTANLIYQFNKGRKEGENYYSDSTYFTRHLFNTFSQLDGGEVKHNVPHGGIADRLDINYKAHNVRAQLNYSHTWVDIKNRQHVINAIVGAEVRDVKGDTRVKRLFGYKKGSPQNIMIDADQPYPIFYDPLSTAIIPSPTETFTKTDRYISYYMTSSYSFLQRYTLSFTARKDESNLFGVRTNQKGIPLFSIGAGWEISAEKFYHLSWLPYLRFRTTHGSHGNVNTQISPYTTFTKFQNNSYGAPIGTIVNPPNPSLRWEKLNMTNFAFDFRIGKNIIDGKIEYYLKRGTDLIGQAPIDPTTGVSQYVGNIADMSGSGVEIAITTTNINKKIGWTSTVLFNYTRDEITDYRLRQNFISSYINSQLFNPLQDRPIYSIYSLRWMGLDSANGDPQGSLNSVVSKDYASILNSRDFRELVYNGPATPTFFGSLRNNFTWKQFGLSFNITWKAGHYFRRNSINYYDLLRGLDPGHPDFNMRWTKPGDELITNIPSLDPSATEFRDAFFNFSEVLVEKGDHIRLQDIELNYSLSKQIIKRLPLQAIHFYIYANNIGILWKATQYDIDPDNVSNIPNPRSYSAGVRLDF